MDIKDLNDLEELTNSIRNLIKDNKKFLEKVLDEDFEPEPDSEEETLEDLTEL